MENKRTKWSYFFKMIRNVIIGNCVFFFPFHSPGALLTFLKRLSDVLECLANTSCHQEASNLNLNYLCKLAGCTFNVHTKLVVIDEQDMQRVVLRK